MIARFVKLSRGVNCEPGQIIIGAGTTVLLQILCLSLKPGTKIGFEEPGFYRSRRMFEANHMDVTPICSDAEGVLPDEALPSESLSHVYDSFASVSDWDHYDDYPQTGACWHGRQEQIHSL